MSDKQYLIDSAVDSFAPHLSDSSGVRVIHLYSTNDSLRKEIRALVGGKTICVEHVIAGTKAQDRNELVQSGPDLALPAEADFVVTKSVPTSRVDWLAARLGCIPVVLPEAADWLLSKLDDRKLLVLVGGDQAR